MDIGEESQGTLHLIEKNPISAMEGEDKICADRIRKDCNCKDPRQYEPEGPADGLDMEFEQELRLWSSGFSRKHISAAGEKTIRFKKDSTTFHMRELAIEDCHMELEELLRGFGDISGLSKGPHTESLWATTISDGFSTQDWASENLPDCVRCHEFKFDSEPWKTDLYPIFREESPLTVYTSQVQSFLLNQPPVTVFASFPLSPPVTPQRDFGIGSNRDWETEDMGKEEEWSCEKQSKRKIEFSGPAEEQYPSSKRLKTVDLTHVSEIMSVVGTDTIPLQPISQPNVATRRNNFQQQPFQTKPPIQLQGAFEGLVRLPQELQDEIWQVAAAQVDTHISVKITTPGGKAGDVKLKCKTPNLHALYSTCTVSRNWFLQRFELTGELMSCKLKGKLDEEEHGRIIRFDPSKEEILFSGSFENHR